MILDRRGAYSLVMIVSRRDNPSQSSGSEKALVEEADRRLYQDQAACGALGWESSSLRQVRRLKSKMQLIYP
jgi:hypothetical protein